MMSVDFFGDHELIFLGTGGGRIHCVTQYRKTGGIIYSFNGTQVHIDPGPGAIVYLNQMKINRLKTKWIVVTHHHTDHSNDAPVIIESVHERLSIPAGTLISTEEYISQLPDFYKDILKQIITIKPGKEVQLTEHTKIKGTKTVHGDVEVFGLIFEQTSPINPEKKYKIAFTSDTEIFPEYSDIYKDVDVFIANVLRPNDRHCDRHTSVDEIIPELKKIRPSAAIITHFGAFMDSKLWSGGDMVPDQAKKIQIALGNDVKVIGATDSLRLNISDLLFN